VTQNRTGTSFEEMVEGFTHHPSDDLKPCSMQVDDPCLATPAKLFETADRYANVLASAEEAEQCKFTN